jgi:uncharacterized protein (UPF0147 family)
MEITNEFEGIRQALSDLQADSTVPKNVKTKIELVLQILDEESDASIRVNKALHELEELSDDTNIQPFIRTQLWNIVSMLESI